MKRTVVIRSASGVGRAGRVGVVKCVVSLVLAMAADGLQWLIPPLWVVCDGFMALALLVIWGWRWEVAVAVLPELVPGLDLFPTWTLFVAYLIAMRRNKPGPPQPQPRPIRRVDPAE